LVWMSAKEGVKLVCVSWLPKGYCWYRTPVTADHFLSLETASTERLPPRKLASRLAPIELAFYNVSNTDDNLSPNFAWKPPAENQHFESKSVLGNSVLLVDPNELKTGDTLRFH
jgi:hypothetical protein